jgi:hypothetical protein
MARIIGGVDPATDHKFSSVWNLNSDVVSQSFNDNVWPTLPNMTIKAWGAGGGGGYFSDGGNSGQGGAGGFTKGSIFLATGTSLYIVVGSGGLASSAASVAPSAGGNGGGEGEGSKIGGQGGGFSGVFLGSSSSDVSQANAVLIAGGGGGGSSFDRTGEDESGGGGGGLQGADGVNPPNAGGGGTQTAGGTAASGVDENGIAFNPGTALQGGAGQSGNGMRSGGGGGGYFGGGGGGSKGGADAEETGGGGGGSGFVKSTMTATTSLVGNSGTAGTPTGLQATINAGADSPNNASVGKGGGAQTDGFRGEVVIIDAVGTRIFTSSQAITTR